MGVGHCLTTYDCPDYYTSFFSHQQLVDAWKPSLAALALQQ